MVDDVLRFDVAESSVGGDHLRNVNDAEAQFIVERLVDLLEGDEAPSACVITPFREQQSYIARLVSEHV